MLTSCFAESDDDAPREAPDEPVDQAHALSSSSATSIATGYSHACSLYNGSEIVCWGFNFDGELGNESKLPQTATVLVSGITNATALAAGKTHTCALLADKTVRCWGKNGDGQLGNGTTVSSSSPVTVSGLTNVAAISAGETHTCARLTDSTLRCWGQNA